MLDTLICHRRSYLHVLLLGGKIDHLEACVYAASGAGRWPSTIFLRV